VSELLVKDFFQGDSSGYLISLHAFGQFLVLGYSSGFVYVLDSADPNLPLLQTIECSGF
jgi:hypothetical protein